MNVEILTIGTELLLGFQLDSNAADLGKALAGAGCRVVRRTTVADRRADIRAAVAEAVTRADAVICTGGLGPTSDDVTKAAVADLWGLPMDSDPQVLAALEARFKRLGRPMPAANKSQAEVPRGATVLANPRGTAPGLWIERDGKVVVLLPGVPKEMRGLLVEQVLPRLAARSGDTVVASRTLRTTGAPESAVAERVAPVEDQLSPLTLAYLPSFEGVDLRLTAWDLPLGEAEALLQRGARTLIPALGEHFYGEGDTDLAAVVLDQIRKRGSRLAVAESCTGGLIGARLTAIPGASAVFHGAVVAYADTIKTAALKVPMETLQAHGAVSEETARAMAHGAQRLFSVDATIAVTGVAGPTGGTPEKPVGTVCMVARLDQKERALTRVFPGDREDVQRRSAQAAMDLLRRLILETI
jgi:competence/damage-inducible protein CinA-like protein